MRIKKMNAGWDAFTAVFFQGKPWKDAHAVAWESRSGLSGRFFYIPEGAVVGVRVDAISTQHIYDEIVVFTGHGSNPERWVKLSLYPIYRKWDDFRRFGGEMPTCPQGEVEREVFFKIRAMTLVENLKAGYAFKLTRNEAKFLAGFRGCDMYLTQHRKKIIVVYGDKTYVISEDMALPVKEFMAKSDFSDAADVINELVARGVVIPSDDIFLYTHVDRLTPIWDHIDGPMILGPSTDAEKYQYSAWFKRWWKRATGEEITKKHAALVVQSILDNNMYLCQKRVA